MSLAKQRILALRRRPRVARTFLALVLLGLAASLAPVAAQSPAPDAAPALALLRPGQVDAVVRQSDGGWVAGGSFASINGEPRAALARFKADGSLDTDWQPLLSTTPGTTLSVTALAVDADGAVFVAGNFSQVNGVARARIAKLAADGTLDPTWNPGVDVAPSILLSDGAGALYLAGEFGSVSGVTRLRLARVSTSGAGAVDPDWNPAPNGSVLALAVGPDGTSYASGVFSSIGGAARSGLARLSATTGAADPDWAPVTNNSVSALLVHDGSLYVGGLFSSIGGEARSGLARLSLTGTGAVDPLWNPGASNGIVSLIVPETADTLLVEGTFSLVGGLPRSFLTRIAADGAGAVDPDFAPASLGQARAVQALPDGRLVVGGSIDQINGTLRTGLFLLDGDGELIEPRTDAERPGQVLALARQPDGAFVIGGVFHRVAGSVRRSLARLRPDRSLDPDWAPVVEGTVNSLALDAGGAVIAGGSFLRAGAGVLRPNLARFDGVSGALDAGWNPAPTSTVFALLYEATGNRLYVGGSFGNIGGSGLARLARIDAGGTGAVDAAWAPAPSGSVAALARDASGLYVGGSFASIGGAARSALARIDPQGTGVADPGFDATGSGSVNAIALRGDGRIYAGGFFASLGGAARSNLARLLPDGSADPGWNAAANAGVLALAVDADDHVYVGGGFSSLGGLSRLRLGRVSGAGSGAADALWNPQANAFVRALNADGAGSMWAGGEFTTVAGQARSGLAALPSFRRADYLAGANGAIAGPTPQFVPFGGNAAAVTAVPDTGFRFTGWSDGNLANPRQDLALTVNLSVGAQFDNDAPQVLAVAAQPASLFEAESTLLTVTAQDDTTPDLLYAFDCDEDGVFEVGPQADASANCILLQPGARSPRVRVLDAVGAATESAASVQALDSIPVAALAPAAQPLEDAAIALEATASVPSSGETIVQVEADCDFDGIAFDADLVAASADGLSCPGFPTPGLRSLALRAFDAEGEVSELALAEVEVQAVNDAPEFAGGPDIEVTEDAGLQQIAAWATAIAPGPSQAGDESGQQLQFELVSNSNPALFAQAPTVDEAGGLSFVPAPDANGSALLGVRLCDDGPSAPPNVACSADQGFLLSVLAVNDAPDFSLGTVPLESPGSSGPRSRPGFAQFDAGPDDEDALQSVDAYLVDAVLDPDGVLQTDSLRLLPDGELIYALSGNSGSVAAALRVRDDGGTALGGVDLSSTRLLSLTVGAGADLQLAASNSVDGLVDGDAVVYAIALTNAGPNAVSGGQLSSVLPASLVEASWACVAELSTAACPQPAGGEGVLSTGFDLAVGAVLRFDLSARVDASGGAFVSVVVEAALPPELSVIDPGNDTAIDVDPILPFALFRSSFEALPAPPSPLLKSALRARN